MRPSRNQASRHSGLELDKVAAICFDLDDTLWPITPVIERAENRLYAWLAENYPRITAAYSRDEMRSLRTRVADEYPAQSHDVTFLRKTALARHAEEAGYSAQMVEDAFEIFLRARHEVTLFDDVLPALERLQVSYRLIAITNGNADLRIIGLDHFIGHTITARDVGAGKPDRAIFAAAITRTGVAPERMVHVGDDPHYDIKGAKDAGLGTIWVNRTEKPWPSAETPPDAEIRNLGELVALLGADDIP